MAKDKSQVQLCLSNLRKHSLRTFIEEKEAFIEDETPSDSQMANKNLVNNKESEKDQSDDDITYQALNF